MFIAQLQSPKNTQGGCHPYPLWSHHLLPVQKTHICPLWKHRGIHLSPGELVIFQYITETFQYITGIILNSTVIFKHYRDNSVWQYKYQKYYIDVSVFCSDILVIIVVIYQYTKWIVSKDILHYYAELLSAPTWIQPCGHRGLQHSRLWRKQPIRSTHGRYDKSKQVLHKTQILYFRGKTLELKKTQ